MMCGRDSQNPKQAREISNAVIAAEQRIGELLLAIPKATPNNNPFHENRDRSNLVKSKSETIKDMGYSKDEASDYQQMAKHPEVVKAVIAKAMNDVLFCSSILA
jgi:Holliday junction resolvasome RuvABC DNA-binding subunit